MGSVSVDNMNKYFLSFQEEFRRYQKLFGLLGYRVYFKYEPLESSFAELTVNQTDMIATIRLNSKLPAKDAIHKNPTMSAKHEALHLLVGRLEQAARYRYTAECEIYEATEDLVRRLETITI